MRYIAGYNVSPPVILCFNFLLCIVHTENNLTKQPQKMLLQFPPREDTREGSQRHLWLEQGAEWG